MQMAQKVPSSADREHTSAPSAHGTQSNSRDGRSEMQREARGRGRAEIRCERRISPFFRLRRCTGRAQSGLTRHKVQNRCHIPDEPCCRCQVPPPRLCGRGKFDKKSRESGRKIQRRSRAEFRSKKRVCAERGRREKWTWRLRSKARRLV